MTSVLMNTIVFEDCRNQWSVSRPLLGLVLLNEKVSVTAGRPMGGGRWGREEWSTQGQGRVPAKPQLFLRHAEASRQALPKHTADRRWAGGSLSRAASSPSLPSPCSRGTPSNNPCCSFLGLLLNLRSLLPWLVAAAPQGRTQSQRPSTRSEGCSP